MTQQSSRAQLTGAIPFPGSAYTWSVPGKPLQVALPFGLIDRLEHLAVENFRSVEALGSEIGGLLFGGESADAPGELRIEDFEAIPCDYSRGPFYRLSNADLTRFDEAIERRGGPAAARVAGFFRSHSRKGLGLDPEDMELIQTRFRDPRQIVLLLRPFATKVSAGGIFIWEDGRMRGEASYLEFPFRSSDLAAANPAMNPPSAKEAGPDASLPPLKPLPRAAVVRMPSRPKRSRAGDPPLSSDPESTQPAAPDSEVASEVPIEAPLASAAPPAAVLADPPQLSAAPPIELVPPAPVAEEDFSESGIKKLAALARGKMRWVLIAAALVACSGAIFLFPGSSRRSAKPPAALTLRIEHTATDLLLTWNRDSEAVRNAKKAVLSITDGDRQENLDMNLSDLRNGSVVYSPLTADVSFHMEIIGPDQSKTASESVRVLRTKPSPMPDEDKGASKPPKMASAPAGSATSTESEPSAAAAAPEEPAVKRQAKTFVVASLGERLRPALPTDLPTAPDVNSAAAGADAVNLNALGPAAAPIARPAAPPAAAAAQPTPEPARDIRQPKLVSQVSPVYPDIARRQRIAGTVSVNAIIGPDGKIRSATATSGPEVLRHPAEEAVKQWVYTPMTLNGHAIETEKQINLNFTLDR